LNERREFITLAAASDPNTERSSRAVGPLAQGRVPLREGEELELQAIPLVLVGPIDGARGCSDAGQHGQ